MSTPQLGLGSPSRGTHPAVLNRRAHDLFVLSAAGGIAVLAALAIAVAVPKPSFTLLAGVLLGALAVTALVVNSRLELSVAFLAIFLGCLDGPIKLLTAGGTVTSALQNVVILAVCIGVVLRVLSRRGPVKLPPLAGWVLAWVFVVVLEAFNPKTHGTLKIIGGFRQQLQWFPFFFFGYMVIRSKQRMRQFFIVLGIIALANGVAATVQTKLSPATIAGWGPGYRERIYGDAAKGITGRKYVSEGQAHVRPFALGSDAGFGGAVGVIALPASLALLATMRRRRWLAALFCLAALVAVATGLGRLQVVGAVIAVLGFAALSSSAGRRIGRPLAALLVVMALALPLGALFVSAVGEGIFSRYSSITPSKVAETSTGYKEVSLKQIPKDIASAPFGFGLGTAGAVGGFGGKVTEELEGHGVSAETQYNFVVDELGLPGLLVYTAFLIRLILLAFGRLRFVTDSELQIDLMGVMAPLIAFLFMGIDGPVMASAAAGPYFWFAGGIAAYWLLGPGRAVAMRPLKGLRREGELSVALS
ncbi:MAG TPA: hypothetical protein VHT29_01490 [Solirubrobacteraceae bacterium]|nr:hypothetical protein [Solirubrobacteraceae bacterium]